MAVDWIELVRTSVDATAGYLAAFGLEEAARLVAGGRDGIVTAVEAAVPPEPAIDPYGLAAGIIEAIAGVLKAAGQGAAALFVRAGAVIVEMFLRHQLGMRLDADRIVATVDLTGGAP